MVRPFMKKGCCASAWPTIRQILTRVVTFRGRGRVGGTRTIKGGLAHEHPREPFQRFSTPQSLIAEFGASGGKGLTFQSRLRFATSRMPSLLNGTRRPDYLSKHLPTPKYSVVLGNALIKPLRRPSLRASYENLDTLHPGVHPFRNTCTRR